MTDTDPITRLNAALEGRYRIEREDPLGHVHQDGEQLMRAVLRTTHPRFTCNLATVALLSVLGCGDTLTVPIGDAEGAVTHSGAFHAVAHPGTGIAEIVVAPDGSRSLRFTNFQTDAGPALEVYLVAAPDATDSQTVLDAGYVTLGALTSPSGNQSYPIPDDLDLTVYMSVSIWCVPFDVNFTTAPLTALPGT